MKAKIIYSKEATPFILEAFGNSINKDGFIIDSKTNDFIFDADGNKFKSEKLIGVFNHNGTKYITNTFQMMDMVH